MATRDGNCIPSKRVHPRRQAQPGPDKKTRIYDLNRDLFSWWEHWEYDALVFGYDDGGVEGSKMVWILVSSWR